jgi:hypothetical protein
LVARDAAFVFDYQCSLKIVDATSNEDSCVRFDKTVFHSQVCTGLISESTAKPRFMGIKDDCNQRGRPKVDEAAAASGKTAGSRIVRKAVPDNEAVES